MKIGDELRDVVLEGRRRFLGTADPTQSGIREWLSQGTSYLIATTEKARFEAAAIGTTWANANGGDCQRFYFAAKDSIVPRSSPNCDPKSIGWAAVSIYYSCFYLAFGLLRSFGRGLMYLSKEDCKIICAKPGTVLLEPGVYDITVELGSPTHIKLRKKAASGFHEYFWRYLDQFLDGLIVEMGQGAGMFSAFSVDHLQVAILDVYELKAWFGDATVTDRRVGWMSALRNDLNYRLARRVWAPSYRANGVDVSRLRQDVVAILRGRSDKLGSQLEMDNDVREMIQRVGVLYRSLQSVMFVGKPI